MSLRKNLLCALFVALSYAFSFIKLFSSIALDSLPAFLAGFVLGPWPGALVGALGHLFTAFSSGFPYTLPAHAMISACMALAVFVSAKCADALFDKSKVAFVIAASLAGAFVNGPVAMAACAWFLFSASLIDSMSVLVSLGVIVTLAGLANVFVASLCALTLRNIKEFRRMREENGRP